MNVREEGRTMNDDIHGVTDFMCMLLGAVYAFTLKATVLKKRLMTRTCEDEVV